VVRGAPEARATAARWIDDQFKPRGRVSLRQPWRRWCGIGGDGRISASRSHQRPGPAMLTGPCRYSIADTLHVRLRAASHLQRASFARPTLQPCPKNTKWSKPATFHRERSNQRALGVGDHVGQVFAEMGPQGCERARETPGLHHARLGQRNPRRHSVRPLRDRWPDRADGDNSRRPVEALHKPGDFGGCSLTLSATTRSQ